VSLSNRFEQLTGQGLSNLTYTIQAATNLNPVIQWSNIGALVANSNGVFSFIDTNATLFPVRFYRAVSP
jgi:ferric iron reductase protein FhuF